MNQNNNENLKVKNTKVVVSKCHSYDLETIIDVIEDSFKSLGGVSSFLKTKDKVLLKPNMIFGMKPERSATTHPVFLEAIIIVLKKHNIKNLWLGDSPGSNQVTEDIISICGFETICKKHNVKIINFVHEFSLFNEDAKFMKKFIVADELHQFDKIINLPKLKTHALTQMTGAVKNLYGLIPGKHKQEFHFKQQDPLDFSALVLDLHQSIEKIIPVFSIMDGIIGMEGKGPTAGTPRRFGVVLMSTSAIALDRIAEEISDIHQVTTTIIAQERNIPESHLENITILGNSISDVQTIGTKVPFSILKHIPKFLFRFVKNLLLSIPVVEKDPCISCNRCADICPVNAIQMKEIPYKRRTKTIPVFDYNKCIRCYCCQEMCPTKAIYLQKTMFSRILFRTKEKKQSKKTEE